MKSLVVATLATMLVSAWAQVAMDPPVGMLEEGPPPLSPEQLALNAKCGQECRTEVCYLADDTDCRNFITCSRDKVAGYSGTVQMCAFGTMWAGEQQIITCDRPSNVMCPINYCAGKMLNENFPHYDNNCKTYWTCGSKGAEPMCCLEGEYFDPGAKRCMRDDLNLCHDDCPFKTDACQHSGQATAFSDDNNCKTYWNCSDYNPYPVCCALEGYGYDPSNGTCVPNGCRDVCPQEYAIDKCSQPGVKTFAILGGSCRTYMRCNPDGNERWCCPSNYVYNPQAQTCEPITPDMNLACDDYCPPSFSEFCPLKANPLNRTEYFTTDFGVDVPMPCAPGTLFDQNKCGCAEAVKGAPDNSCNMEVDIIFDIPYMINSGSQSNVRIIQLGQAQGNITLNGRTPWVFNGSLMGRIPFAQQPYDRVYTSLIFYPEELVGMGRKQVLLSNCMNLDLGGPSLEVALQDGQVVSSIVSVLPAGEQMGSSAYQAISAVPYQVKQWQVLTVVYDGQTLRSAIEGQGIPVVDSQPLRGSIPVAAEGLDFGGCYVNRRNNEGFFVGSMAKLQFSKCLKQEWVDSFNQIVATANSQRPLPMV